MAEPTPPAVIIPDPPPAAVSPTGKPLVPAAIVPYVLAAIGVATVVASCAEAGLFGAQSPLVARIAEGAGVLLAALMGTTPGLRKAAS